MTFGEYRLSAGLQAHDLGACVRDRVPPKPAYRRRTLIVHRAATSPGRGAPPVWPGHEHAATGCLHAEVPPSADRRVPARRLRRGHAWLSSASKPNSSCHQSCSGGCGARPSEIVRASLPGVRRDPVAFAIDGVGALYQVPLAALGVRMRWIFRRIRVGGATALFDDGDVRDGGSPHGVTLGIAGCQRAPASFRAV